MRIYTLSIEIEILGITRDVDVEFTYTPGEPERGPSYASGGEPATGPEIEIISVLAEPHDRLDPSKNRDGGSWIADVIQDALRKGTLDPDRFTDVVVSADEAGWS